MPMSLMNGSLYKFVVLGVLLSPPNLQDAHLGIPSALGVRTTSRVVDSTGGRGREIAA